MRVERGIGTVFLLLLLLLPGTGTAEINFNRTGNYIEIKKDSGKDSLLDLLYSVYLENKKLEKALQVTLIAIKKFPNSLTWWERLKTVAGWSSKPELVLKALEKLVFHFHKWSYLKELLSTAIALNRPNLAAKTVKLMLKRGIKVDYRQVVNIFSAVGRPDEAARILFGKFNNNPEALRIAARIFWYRGEPDTALKVMDTLKRRYGLKPEDKLLLARIYFARRQFRKSLDILKEGWKNVENVQYLKTLSNLAWTLGDFRTAVSVSKKLISKGQGTRDDFQRIIFYFYHRKPALAAEYALKGYRELKDESFLNSYIFFLTILKKRENIVNFFDQLSPNIRNKLMKKPDIFSTYVYALIRTGRAEEARKLIHSQLKKSSRPPAELVSQFIHLLIASNDTEGLRLTLKKYKEYEAQIPKDFASGYLFLQNGRAAMRCIARVKDDSFSFLLTKADILELYGKEGEARKIRFKVFRKTKEKLKTGAVDEETAESYLRSAIFFQQPEKFEEDFAKLKNFLNPNLAREIYLAYLFYRGYTEKIKYLKERKRIKLKPWMELSLAIYRNDNYAIKELLSKYSKLLPIRDRVYALNEIEEFGRAISTAYSGLKENEDNRLYRQFRDLIVRFSSVASINTSFQKSGKFRYVHSSFELRWHTVDNLYLLLNREDFNPLNGGGLLKKKRRMSGFSFGIEKLFHKLSFTGNLHALRGGNKSKGGVFLKVNEKFHRESTLTFEFFLNAKSTVSELASLSTYRSGGKIECLIPLSNRYSIFGSLQTGKYYSLDKTYIGKGRELYSELSYKARSGYPDYLFRIFFSTNRYKESKHFNSYSDKIASSKPADVLPKSFYQVGTGLSFGFENRESFIRVWRPYLDTSLTFNSAFGMNASLLMGTGGKLLGRDNLHFEVLLFNGFKGTNSSGFVILSGYRLWF